MAGDVDYDLEVFRSTTTGASTLIDAQGNRAAVIGKPTEYGKMVFWDVNNVLFSGEWTSQAVAPDGATGHKGTR